MANSSVVVANVTTGTAAQYNNLRLDAFSLAGAIFNVMDPTYGATGDGVTDDIAAILAACTAAGLVNGTVLFPPATYYCSTSIVLTTNIRILGYGAVLLFGATNGIQINHNYAVTRIEGIDIRTNSASGGKAIYLGFGVLTPQVRLRDVTISVVDYTADRWAFGVWATDWESSDIFNLKLYAAATVGVHLESTCNALRFYDTIITAGIGTAGPTPIEHCIEVEGTLGVSLFGGTLQGYSLHSGLRVLQSSIQAYGVHFENTYATPTDGDDVFLDRSYDCIFSGCVSTEGIITDGACRNTTVIGCSLVTYVGVALSDSNNLIGSRIGTLTLSDWDWNNVIGCVDTGGNAYAIRLASETTHKGVIGGNGTVASFWTDATDRLRTSGKLIADLGIGVGNSASATTLGNVIGKALLYDETGASRGYYPLYDAIT